MDRISQGNQVGLVVRIPVAVRYLILLVLFVSVVAIIQPESQVTAKDPQPIAPSGIESRIPFTKSRVIGRPDPPLPFQARRVFESVKIDHPTHIVAEPKGTGGSENGGTERILVIEQKGRVLAFSNSPDPQEGIPFVAIDDHETYGVTFHPKYRENRWVYVFSNGPQSDPKKRFNRVTRYTVRKQPPFVCDPASALQIIEWESNGHNGGDMAFGPDGMFYISAGDGTTDSDTNLTGQKISDLVSGMIRIDLEHPAPGMNYGIPTDNPFLKIPGARGELWAYGFRNPWKIHFDPQGHLWCGDIGQDSYEMIELVEKGDNYGWSVMEGGNPFYLERDRGPTPIKTAAIVHPHSEARSITGGVTYHGNRLPNMKGAYIYGDYGTGKIWAARAKAGKIIEHQEIADTPYQILGFGVDAAGEIYFVDYSGNAIYTLEPTPTSTAATPPFPRKLSDTGLFLDVARNQVDPGLVSYSVNSPLWSDGAHKERFLALPGESQITFSESDHWKFPEGTVFVKSFSLANPEGSSQSYRRVETRLMVIQQNEWVGYSYRWNDAQTDAELVDAKGADVEYNVRNPAESGGTSKQTWHFPSRAECMVCHTRAASYVLGFTLPQLNRVHDYGGTRANQLTTYEHLKLFKNSDGENLTALPRAVDELARLADPYSTQDGLEKRVRSYLHANCSHCHVEAGGGNAAMELAIKTPTDKARIVDVLPLHDKFGIADPRLIAPGSPERSVLLRRLSQRGKGQMPPLAAAHVDTQAVELLRAWILQLQEGK